MRSGNWWVVWLIAAMPMAAYAELATTAVQRSRAQNEYVAEGAVEAVRTSLIAAQTTGRITALSARAGDRVNAGQVLAKIDERIAADQLTASRAQLDAARNEYERNKNLFAKQYISKATMDRAEAQYKTQRAQAAGFATQTQLHTITAPYAGVIANVDIELGDMAMPGKPLLTLYAPDALRVTVQVSESIAQVLRSDKAVTIEVPAVQGDITASSIEVLPTRDSISHSAEIQLMLPKNIAGVVPGQFARAHLPINAAGDGALRIPITAVVRRAEFDAVYVIDKQGRAQLRQVRLGQRDRASVEVLAGLDAGERIALDPLAAAKQ